MMRLAEPPNFIEGYGIKPDLEMYHNLMDSKAEPWAIYYIMGKFEMAKDGNVIFFWHLMGQNQSKLLFELVTYELAGL